MDQAPELTEVRGSGNKMTESDTAPQPGRGGGQAERANYGCISAGGSEVSHLALSYSATPTVYQGTCVTSSGSTRSIWRVCDVYSPQK